MVFVKPFEVVDEWMLFTDESSCTLKCVRLRWQRTFGRAGQLTSAFEFNLIPPVSVGGYAHLVKKDVENDISNGFCPLKAEAMNLGLETDGWSLNLLYVTRLRNMQTVQ